MKNARVVRALREVAAAYQRLAVAARKLNESGYRAASKRVGDGGAGSAPSARLPRARLSAEGGTGTPAGGRRLLVFYVVLAALTGTCAAVVITAGADESAQLEIAGGYHAATPACLGSSSTSRSRVSSFRSTVPTAI